jgi:Zn-dependent protease with chaperone function
MSNRVSRLFAAGLTALLLVTATAAPASAARSDERPQEKDSGKDKKDKKEKKDDKDDRDKPSKQEREYQKIKQYSEELYSKDAAFHDAVEEAYRQKQREHSEFAFDVNTRDASDEKIMRTGDKLKVFDSLYDNPLVQDYVNRLGQSLVPKNSTRLYAFKVTLNPIPEARSLSTGTIYVSSGLISLADNEAQLAYILGHEIAHIEKDHWHDDVLVVHGMDRYNEKQQKKRAIFSAVATVATGGMFKAAGGSFLEGAGVALLIAPTLLKYIVPNATVTWDKSQEDEADRLGLQYMLDRNYDPREAPKFYAGLKETSNRDRRTGLGFIGEASRVEERTQQVGLLLVEYAPLMSSKQLAIGSASLALRNNALRNSIQTAAPQPAPPATAAATDPGKQMNPSRDAEGRQRAAEKQIGGQMSAEIQAKLDSGELIGSSGEFEAVMAELKRDNGVRAYYYDMFQMARDNLQESLMIRSNDPHAHLYYGKVLKLTARTPDEKRRALSEFVKAIELDRRRVLPEAHLHRALAMIESRDSSQTRDIVESLKEYVSLYQRENGGTLPPNMEVIYDYLQEAGEMTWAARPAMNVSTKNIDPLTTAPGAVTRPAEPAPAPAAEPQPQRARPNRKP